MIELRPAVFLDRDGTIIDDLGFLDDVDRIEWFPWSVDAIRALKQVKRGDRVLCYHSAPERSLYSIAEVTRDPYPDPHDHKGKNLVADLRAFEKLPRPVTLAEMRGNPALRKAKLLKNVRLIISSITEAEYQELLRMAGIVATPGVPLP